MNYRYEPLQLLKTTIEIGLPAPVKLLHVTDSHIALDDPGRDCGRARAFEGERVGLCADYLEQAIACAKENGMPILHTGDLLDFLSEANYAYMDRVLDGVDYIYAAGNHDFCHCVGEAKEDAAYKWDNMKRTAPHVKSNLHFDARVIGGVNIVTLDDSYYLISDGQLEMLRAEAAKGYPMILCMHVPLFTPELADVMLSNGHPCAYLTGANEAYLSRYPQERRLQQTPDEATLRAIDAIKREKAIKAIVAGHTHINYEGRLENGVMQYLTDGSYHGWAREITII